MTSEIHFQLCKACRACTSEVLHRYSLPESALRKKSFKSAYALQ